MIQLNSGAPNTPVPIAQSGPIDYGKQSPSHRTRRIAFLVVIAVSTLGVLLYTSGKDWYRWGKLAYIEWQCRTTPLSADRIVHEEDPQAAYQLLMSSSKYTSFKTQRTFDSGQNEFTSGASFEPRYWNQFELRSGRRTSRLSFEPVAVVFLHEMVSPAGTTRLVCLTYTPGQLAMETAPNRQLKFEASVFSIAGLSGGKPRELYSAVVASGIVSSESSAPKLRIYGGELDAGDRSRFNFRLQAWGRASSLAGQLDERDKLTLILKPN